VVVAQNQKIPSPKESCDMVWGIFRKKKHLAKYVCSRKELFSMFHMPYFTILPLMPAKPDEHIYTI
jgi:hypothetical protein